MRYCDFQAQLCDHLVTTQQVPGAELAETPTPQEPKHRPLCETCRTRGNFAITINLNEETILLLAILIAVVLLLR